MNDKMQKFNAGLFWKDFGIYDLKMANRIIEKNRKAETDKLKLKKTNKMIKNNIWGKDHSKRSAKPAKHVE